MQQYIDIVKHVLNKGTRKENRTGVDTLSTFGYYYEHDLNDGFPLLTTKKINWTHIVAEMLWFISGQTHLDILKRHGCKFWDAWADDQGKVPSAYGNFWRQFPVHGSITSERKEGAPDPLTYTTPSFNDQLAWVLAELRKNPMSRRMVVSAWAPGNAQTSKLPPCHCMFMFNVQNVENVEGFYNPRGLEDGPEKDRLVSAHGHAVPVKTTEQRLCLHLTQRSCDVALGVPYNIASYALLLCLFSHLSGIKPGIFAHTLVDAHIYTKKPDGSMAEFDHVPGLVQQLVRDPKPLPRLVIDESIRDLSDIERLMHPSVSTEEVMRHFRLEGYDPHPQIPFRVAV